MNVDRGYLVRFRGAVAQPQNVNGFRELLKRSTNSRFRGKGERLLLSITCPKLQCKLNSRIQ